MMMMSTHTRDDIHDEYKANWMYKANNKLRDTPDDLLQCLCSTHTRASRAGPQHRVEWLAPAHSSSKNAASQLVSVAVTELIFAQVALYTTPHPSRPSQPPVLINGDNDNDTWGAPRRGTSHCPLRTRSPKQHLNPTPYLSVSCSSRSSTVLRTTRRYTASSPGAPAARALQGCVGFLWGAGGRGRVGKRQACKAGMNSENRRVCVCVRVSVHHLQAITQRETADDRSRQCSA